MTAVPLDIEAVRTLAGQGLTGKEAAAKLGVPYDRMMRNIRPHGIKFRNANLIHSDEILRAVEIERDSGKALKAIAVERGLQVQSLSRALHDMGRRVPGAVKDRGHYRKWPDAVFDDCRAIIAAGGNHYDIAKKYDVTPVMAKKRCRDAGILYCGPSPPPTEPTWSATDLQLVREIFARGGTHTDVAKHYKISRQAAAGRCRRAKVMVEDIRPAKFGPHTQEDGEFSAARPPMPPGDLSWTLMTAGTLLEGARYA